MPSKANDLMERAQQQALEKGRFYQRCIIFWLKGYSVDYIANRENVAISAIMQAITIKRKELQESQVADMEELIAERIGGLRQIQQEAHEYLDFLPEKAPQLLTVALRAEEMVAKIQGVLSDKVLHLGRIQHEVKLYDFEDKTPPQGIIEGISKIIFQEPELPPLSGILPISGEEVDKIVEVPIPVKKEIPKVRVRTFVGGTFDVEDAVISR